MHVTLGVQQPSASTPINTKDYPVIVCRDSARHPRSSAAIRINTHQHPSTPINTKDYPVIVCRDSARHPLSSAAIRISMMLIT
ncbi:MAG: hypothetical protein ACI9W6_002393 [Motiliproteus sp.]